MSPSSASAAGLRVTAIILGAQISVIIAASLLAYGFYSTQHARSALLGGMICLLTTAMFAWRMFAGRNALSADQVLRRFYSGLVQKFVLTVVLLMVAILWLDIVPVALIVVYAISLSTFWFALLVKTR